LAKVIQHQGSALIQFLFASTMKAQWRASAGAPD